MGAGKRPVVITAEVTGLPVPMVSSASETAWQRPAPPATLAAIGCTMLGDVRPDPDFYTLEYWAEVLPATRDTAVGGSA